MDAKTAIDTKTEKRKADTDLDETARKKIKIEEKTVTSSPTKQQQQLMEWLALAGTFAQQIEPEVWIDDNKRGDFFSKWKKINDPNYNIVKTTKTVTCSLTKEKTKDEIEKDQEKWLSFLVHEACRSRIRMSYPDTFENKDLDMYVAHFWDQEHKEKIFLAEKDKKQPDVQYSILKTAAQETKVTLEKQDMTKSWTSRVSAFLKETSKDERLVVKGLFQMVFDMQSQDKITCGPHMLQTFVFGPKNYPIKHQQTENMPPLSEFHCDNIVHLLVLCNIMFVGYMNKFGQTIAQALYQLNCSQSSMVAAAKYIYKFAPVKEVNDANDYHYNHAQVIDMVETAIFGAMIDGTKYREVEKVLHE